MSYVDRGGMGCWWKSLILPSVVPPQPPPTSPSPYDITALFGDNVPAGERKTCHRSIIHWSAGPEQSGAARILPRTSCSPRCFSTVYTATTKHLMAIRGEWAFLRAPTAYTLAPGLWRFSQQSQASQSQATQSRRCACLRTRNGWATICARR